MLQNCRAVGFGYEAQGCTFGIFLYQSVCVQGGEELHVWDSRLWVHLTGEVGGFGP